MNYEFKFPDVGEGLHEAEIVRWLVCQNQFIKADDPVVEVQTDKSVVEIPSPVAGKVVSLAGEEGSIIRVGEVLITIEQVNKQNVHSAHQSHPDRTSMASKVNSVINESASQILTKPAKRALAAPTVRKLARELGVNLEKIEGTGPGGRVLEEDVRTVNNTITLSTSSTVQDPVTEKRVEQVSENKVEEVPFVGLRRKISEKMIKSVYTIPHATGMTEMDVTKLVELRKSLLPFAEEQGCKLTYLPFIIKAVTKSLKKYPYLNASLDEERGKIILKKYYNIGIATATKDGLIVPVVKDADQKSILEIAQELEILTEKTRQRKIDAKSLQDGTFTISSTGKIGGAFATPIINHPEAAILGVHAIKEKPAVVNGEIAIRSMMGTSLSFDHRLIDGEDSGLFLDSVTQILENPECLLLEVR
ncbi:pyruvate dehydrogenase E2 component (dihydrolipoamide acetyltransferase) [Neobacillus niacini]|uniref:dihydrolipoamide acetyltransferase family protein n=1 Tax=Neobacillus niacini TaxID=86668 RepID=UPI002780DFC0|nr:dihydrolipoamide acetyltransferase family protein [Neobacillus niacini]MDQ1002914.1 pyruvate dehydrogenase E2 component (dihydrolipoamide acetyltransferase) [Neobacillus niacini]